ncbi:MAG: hypothetical protein AB1918_00925 [Pseudomonadota bacterium]
MAETLDVYNEETLYRHLWANRLTVLDGILASERNLSRALAILDEFARTYSLSVEGVGSRTGKDGQTARLTGRAIVQPNVVDPADRDRFPDCPLLPTGVPAFAYTVESGNRTIRPFYGTYDDVVVNWLLEAVNDRGYDAIVELGSGFGQKLFQLYLAGGPGNIPYFGAELWEEGRRGAERLAALEPALDFRSVAFDFNAPDLSFLAGFRKVLLFTNAALCNVTTLPGDLMERLSAAAPQVMGYHFEFVGHQIRRDVPALAWFYRMADERKYNTNFVQLFLDAHRGNRIRAHFLAPDVYDVSSGHPVTVAIWSGGTG